MKCEVCGMTGIERQAAHGTSLIHLKAELASLVVAGFQILHDRPVPLPVAQKAPTAAWAARAVEYLTPGLSARRTLVEKYRAGEKPARALVAATARCLRLIREQEGRR